MPAQEKNTEIKLTPLMDQYHRIKREYPGALIFFRLGDFYEMFGEDAKKASRILNIALTSRQGYPMCGVPHHASENYLSKLIRAGLKVGIVEQMEDPSKAKGLVKRDLVRLVTPGTLVEDALLQKNTNNFAGAVFFKEDGAGLAFADISTGEVYLSENLREAVKYVGDEISRKHVGEIVVNESGWKVMKERLPGLAELTVTELEDWHFLPEEGKEVLKRILNASTLSGIGVEDKPLALAAFHALYQYLLSTQKRELTYLTRVQFYSQSDFMLLDEASVRNLELVRNLSEGTARASLLEVLDHTVTGMGGRLLKRWILYPLVEKEAVASRAARVDFFFQRQTLMEEARKILKDIHDLERILARVNFGTANARDLVNLKNSLIPLKALSSLLEEEGIRTHEELSLFLGRALLDSPPATLTEGGMIRPDFDERLKELSAAREESEAWIMDLEKRERERTGISSLKVGYTSIFGYYIEVTNSNLKLVPLDYVRKQTLVNSERFVTPELKEKENFILTSEEKKKQMEYGIFQELREKVRKETQILQKTAEKVAALDVLATLAFVAARNGYVRPEISDDETILIEEGRHPVVEKNIREQFTPNDLLLDRAENQILLITGPNMAGKSVYIKQAALITIMAQMGGFVPAGRAKIGIVDRIFTRIGSGENLGKGLSTFMVEMMEVSNILHNATGKSLVIMDEVGRGTSTFDGISIAWACLEYLSLTNNPHAPRILFATHFFELTSLSETIPNIKNCNVAVREYKNRVVFLHKIMPGSTDKSYGIHVAALAGLPQKVVSRSWEILRDLEEETVRKKEKDGFPQLDLFEREPEIIRQLKDLDITGLTPLEALNLLSELKKKTGE